MTNVLNRVSTENFRLKKRIVLYFLNRFKTK